jgi:hypothetical protein
MIEFGFERRHQPLASQAVYRRRLLRSMSVAGLVIAVSLAGGVLGYRYIGGLPSWVDSLYNAAMILGGMGPVSELRSDAGKIFASVYALYSGVALLTSVGVLVAPALHRMLHRFHIEAEPE